jgi:hypothetical protein
MIELRDALIGPGGPTPSDLMQVIAANPMSKDTPEGQEPVIFTEMTFDLSDPRSAKARLRRSEPTFEQVDDDEFIWTRRYPKNHWSPFAMLGGRQALGSVTIADGMLIAEAKTLSMAAKLAVILKDVVGGALQLRSTQWRGAQEMLRQVKARAG